MNFGHVPSGSSPAPKADEDRPKVVENDWFSSFASGVGSVLAQETTTKMNSQKPPEVDWFANFSGGFVVKGAPEGSTVPKAEVTVDKRPNTEESDWLGGLAGNIGLVAQKDQAKTVDKTKDHPGEVDWFSNLTGGFASANQRGSMIAAGDQSEVCRNHNEAGEGELTITGKLSVEEKPAMNEVPKKEASVASTKSATKDDQHLTQIVKETNNGTDLLVDVSLLDHAVNKTPSKTESLADCLERPRPKLDGIRREKSSSGAEIEKTLSHPDIQSPACIDDPEPGQLNPTESIPKYLVPQVVSSDTECDGHNLTNSAQGRGEEVAKESQSAESSANGHDVSDSGSSLAEPIICSVTQTGEDKLAIEGKSDTPADHKQRSFTSSIQNPVGMVNDDPEGSKNTSNDDEDRSHNNKNKNKDDGYSSDEYSEAGEAKEQISDSATKLARPQLKRGLEKGSFHAEAGEAKESASELAKKSSRPQLKRGLEKGSFHSEAGEAEEPVSGLAKKPSRPPLSRGLEKGSFTASFRNLMGFADDEASSSSSSKDASDFSANEASEKEGEKDDEGFMNFFGRFLVKPENQMEADDRAEASEPSAESESDVEGGVNESHSEDHIGQRQLPVVLEDTSESISQTHHGDDETLLPIDRDELPKDQDEQDDGLAKVGADIQAHVSEATDNVKRLLCSVQNFVSEQVTELTERLIAIPRHPKAHRRRGKKWWPF